MILNAKPSDHLLNDRSDRLTRIALNCGFGEEVKKVRGKNGHILTLTTTGVIFVMSKDEKVIITAYTATMPQVQAIFYNGQEIPRSIKCQVERNDRRGFIER